MKRLLYIVLASLVLVACGGSGAYRINGIVDGVEDGTVMTLSALSYDSMVTLDSVEVKNGKFMFKGETDTVEMAVITFDHEDGVSGCQFFLEPGKIEVLVDAVNGDQHLAGTPNNDAFQKFFDDTEALSDEADEIEDKIRVTLASQGDCSDLYKQMNDIQVRFRTMLFKTIEENADKLYGYQQLIQNYSMFEPEETAQLIEKLAPAFGDDLAFMQLSSMISSQLSTSLGKPYIDFEASILDKKSAFSNKARLSTYVQANKVVLLDFWASWCTPCLNELPNLKSAYKRFKSKGFEIVSVSVDDETADWIKAVKDNGMDWVQLWNGDADDIQNSPAIMYSVSAIPSTFLIDAEGTIIGRNLRDNELEDALEDFFKNH